MKSRSKSAAASVKEAPVEPVAPKPLPEPDTHSPTAFILPETLNEDASIITLSHPRRLKPTRYYHCKKTGFHEIKRISSGPGSRRSLLLAPERSSQQSVNNAEGHVVKTAAFFAVTPIDALFLFLPTLSPISKDNKEYKSMFLTLDDYLENLDDASKPLQRACEDDATMRLVKARISVVCDKVEAGDDTMYRLSHEKLLKCILAKAENMVKSGLPVSMEAYFVKKPLEVPMAYLLQERHSQPSLMTAVSADDLDESQETTGTITPAATDSSFSESQATNITVPSPPASTEPPQSSLVATEELKNSLRLRVALNFLFSSYVPPHLVAILENMLSLPTSPVDFGPLAIHLAQLAKLKAEISAQARELMTGDSRKRALEDEEAAADRDEKKRKKEEEEKKKRANESRGIRDLKKVNTKGMKKMSDFFGKKS